MSEKNLATAFSGAPPTAVVTIIGPTASGKSDLAALLAREFSGEVVSADSRQVYKWMDIGTGKITKEEMQGVPHHLLDVADPNEQFNAAQYKKLATEAIADIHARGKLPILAGGTGLYIQAVVDGIAFPEVPPNKVLRDTLRNVSAEELFAQLQKKDPNRAASIDPKNKRRLIRALEIIEATGKPVPGPEVSSQKSVARETLLLGIDVPREKLNEKIEQRFDAWLKEGFIDEVRALYEKHNVSWGRLEELGLNYKWGARYIQGSATEDEMRAQSIKEIQQYAKRQMTWFKRDQRVHWITSTDKAQKLVARFIRAH